jgi:hypothetical protein
MTVSTPSLSDISAQDREFFALDQLEIDFGTQSRPVADMDQSLAVDLDVVVGRAS